MKVKELVAKLSELDQELEVYCCTDENFGFSKGKHILAMPVQDPYEMSAKIFRESSGQLVLQIEDSERPKTIAVVDFSVDER